MGCVNGRSVSPQPPPGNESFSRLSVRSRTTVAPNLPHVVGRAYELPPADEESGEDVSFPPAAHDGLRHALPIKQGSDASAFSSLEPSPQSSVALNEDDVCFREDSVYGATEDRDSDSRHCTPCRRPSISSRASRTSSASSYYRRSASLTFKVRPGPGERLRVPKSATVPSTASPHGSLYQQHQRALAPGRKFPHTALPGVVVDGLGPGRPQQAGGPRRVVSPGNCPLRRVRCSPAADHPDRSN